VSAPDAFVGVATEPRLASGWQQRFESSRAGRFFISAFLVAAVGGIVVANLPDGDVQRRLARMTQPYMNATGLGQRWDMFSNPRTEILYLEARVEHADGSVSVWRPPAGGPLLGSYRDAHWRKFVEHAVPQGSPDTWPQLWEPLARYAASHVPDGGSPPVRVTLVKRSAFSLAPGDGPDHTPFREEAYYTLRLQ
jgi:hypothetical protein